MLLRELEYHEKLYSGVAQQHFAKPAVRAFRAHLAERILKAAGLGRGSRVLSLGCGIGDTEILLAPQVKEIVGVDLSATGIRQARADAARAGMSNARFEEGTIELVSGQFDAAIAVFFLHHLDDAALEALPSQVASRLRPGGVFYALDPSRWRLSGFLGTLLCPKLMAKYQTPDERELDSGRTALLFEKSGFASKVAMYDFVSTPLAGLFPGWVWGYRTARRFDEILVRVPGVRGLGSNFEIVATRA